VGAQRGVRGIHTAQLGDAEEVADWVIRTARDGYRVDLTTHQHPVGVDMDGIGWGVGGILRRRGVHVLEIRGNETSDVDPRRYANKRAEAYGELAKRLDPEGQWVYKLAPDAETPTALRGRLRFWRQSIFGLPDVEYLKADLRAHEKLYARDGFRFAVTPKRKVAGIKNQPVTVQEKIGRSPDYGDSCVYFYRALQVRGMSLEKALDAGFF
jgi:hypothetical protein